MGRKSGPAARNTLDSARIPRASKLLICGLLQKGRVLAQDGVPSVQFTAAANTLEVREHIWGDDELQCHNLPDLVADGEVGKAWPDQ